MADGVIRRSVRTWSLLVALLVTFLVSPSVAEEGDAFVLFDYKLVTSSYFGKISDEALPGSHIPVDDTLPTTSQMTEKDYIKLGLIRKAPPHPGTSHNHSSSILLSLPPGVGWYVSEVEGEMEEGKGEEITKEGGGEGEGQVDKNIFTVGGDFFVSIRNPHSLALFSEIEFWVVARGHDAEAVSNPLSFIVKVEHKETGESGSTVYVGIVVVVICFFALLIPITVRTKRRLRENRPICACGSSQDKSDGQKAEDGTGSSVGPRDPQRDSLAASLYGSRGSMQSDPHRHETFQHHMLRSDSDHHFQPRWLDPHFRHEYEHPQYKPKVQSPLERVRQSSMASGSSGRSDRVVGKY